jgi:hypothetical protein
VGESNTKKIGELISSFDKDRNYFGPYKTSEEEKAKLRAKIYLHFCQEDFISYNIDQQRNQLRNYYPHIQIFWANEHMSKDSIQYRYKQLELNNIDNNISKMTI